MAKKKMTVLDFKKFKEEGRKFAYCTAYDYTTASIVNESNVEVILVGDSLAMVMLGYNSTVGVTLDDMIHHIRPVVKGAPNTFVAGDMPFGAYQESPEQAIRSACRILMETNCDCVKLEGGANMAPTIKRMVDVGIPVMGHIGLTPQSASSIGGFKVQGGTPDGAKKLIEDAKALEEAGVFSIVVECVPNVVGKALTEAVSVPILGIGAGPDVDCQVLVTQDLLGMAGKKVIPMEEHVQKIRAAVYARKDPDFIIIGRTDARQAHGIEDAIARGKAYAEAGADVIFVEAQENMEELERVPKEINGVPLVVNMIEGGRTPLLSKDELGKMGYQVIFYNLGSLYSQTKAIQDYCEYVIAHGTSAGFTGPMVNFDEFNRIVGLPELRELEEKFKV